MLNDKRHGLNIGLLPPFFPFYVSLSSYFSGDRNNS